MWSALRKVRLLMSKYGFSLIIMILEIILVFGLFFYLGEITPLIWQILVGLMSVFTILSIVNRSMAPDSKVTWLLFANIPVVGPLIYLMFGERRLSKKEVQQLDNMAAMKFRESNSRELRQELKERDKVAYGLVKSILTMDHNADIYDESQSTFYPSGQAAYEQMLKDLRQAKRFIFLEYYIIEDGIMWQGILDILKEKLAQGLEIKVLYDDIGCMATLPGNYTKKLQELGIEAYRFNRVIPRLTVAYNNRSHRKIMVIDGQIAYTGGINLADEYINAIERFGYWKDSALRMEGHAVKAMTRLFLMNWYVNGGGATDLDSYHLENTAVSTDGLYVPYGSGPKPMYKEQVGKAVYQNLINQATDFVYITTPYLIIDYDLMEDIRNAALRGVDVRIVTPYIPDKKLIQLITRGSYPSLLEAGVRIYEYSPGFIHSKQVLVDERFAVVGSINFDYRSLVHHYENAVLLYKTSSIKAIGADFQEIFAQSEEIKPHTIRTTWYQDLLREVVQLFAPML